MFYQEGFLLLVTINVKPGVDVCISITFILSISIKLPADCTKYKCFLLQYVITKEPNLSTEYFRSLKLLNVAKLADLAEA